MNTPQKKSVPYIDILKQSGHIVWENRFLLWFGLLIALGSPGSFNLGRNDENFGPQGDTVQNFVRSHWQIVIAFAIFFVLIGIVLFLISLVAKAGLVKSVNTISHQNKTNFSEGWQSGKNYLGKLFWIALVFFLAIFATLVILSIPVIYLLAAKSWMSAVLVGVLAFAIFIPLLFVFALTKIFAEFYIVLSDLKLWSAIESGYDLLLKNILHSIVFSLLILAVSIAAWIIFAPVIAIAALIFVPAGFIFFSLSKIAFGIFLAAAIVLLLAAILIISSIFRTFETTAWTLFFWEIAKAETPEAEIAAEEIEKSIAITPEKA